MSKVPTGFVASSKQAIGHAADASKVALGAGKDMAVNANSRLAGHLADKGAWGTLKHGVTKYPLVAGAAAVGATYVAGTAIMGRNQQRVLEARAAQEQGLQR